MSLISFYNPLILVTNFKLRSETSIDRDRVHPTDKWKRWFGIFGIYFFIKTDMDLVYCITWIHHRKVYDISLTIKRKIDKKIPLRWALGHSRFTQPSIRGWVDFCFNTEWNVVNFSVINSCDRINRIHVNFDEINLSWTCQTSVFTYSTGGHDLCLSRSLIEVWSYWRVWTDYKSWLVTQINRLGIVLHVHAYISFAFNWKCTKLWFQSGHPSNRFLPCWKRL
jgi:hypothetical protein